MNLVGFSRRDCLPIMQRQMPPVLPKLLLMFKVMQRDRLIKRRLRDALGPSLSCHDGLVTSRSRVLQPRDGGRRMEIVPQEHPLTYKHTYTHTHWHTHTHAYIAHQPSSPTFLSLWQRLHSSAEFTIVQVFTERHLSHILIKAGIYSGTVAKSHRGERDLKE